MSKVLFYGQDARNRIKSGIDKAADAVKPTLGVVGRTAVIEWTGLDPIEADDGVTILKNLEFKDKCEEIGLNKLRKAAVRTSTIGGDGTATTTVLTQALTEEAFKNIAPDASNIREIQDRLDTGLEEVIAELQKVKKDITEEDIFKIAQISSLDPQVSEVIAEAIKKVGIHGVITIEKSAQLGYYSEIVKGAQFEAGLISPYFITNNESQTCELEDAYIVLVDRKISTNEQIIPILQAIGTGKNILFIADAVEGLALASLVANTQNKVATLCGVANPYSASRARDFLFDMAALTGGKVISEEAGMKFSDVKPEYFGRAEKVIVSKDKTTIIGGKSSDDLDIRVLAIQNDINSTTSEFYKKILQERLAQLTAGIGVIRVGAYTDSEFNTKKYKFENAVNATLAALQEGIVPGGGVALATAAVKEPIFKKALIAPLKQMAINAGLDWYTVVNNVQSSKKGAGYDFRTRQMVNMFESGIIDPFKVTRLALESATAIAKSLVNIDVCVVNDKEDNDNK